MEKGGKVKKKRNKGRVGVLLGKLKKTTSAFGVESGGKVD